MTNDNYVDITIENLDSTGRNNKEKIEEFRDKAFGMFIHWSLDSYIGCTISHWMCGADYALIDRYINETPNEFYPRDFMPDAIATLAKQAGMKYMCFTTKHHSGFCMFNTKTTNFNIMNTPFKRDVFRELTDAFVRKGITPGIYFSPLDFLWNYKKGHRMHFKTPDVIPVNNPELMEYNRTQMTELMTSYGDMGLVFFDGPPEGLKDIVWDIQPECLITRGEMKTPEVELPDNMLDEPWEACYYLGESWGYRPYGDILKTPLEIIELLIKTRAKGGNLLLNVTPDCDGKIPDDQVKILREIGLYLFFNSEAIYKVRPYKLQNENNIWFTKSKDNNTVYAFILNEQWKYGYDFKSETENWNELTIKGVRATENTEIELVGQTGLVMQHRENVNPKTKWYQDEEGIHIKAMVAFRPHDNRKWEYPICIRITNVEE